jgi:hypothetical protein
VLLPVTQDPYKIGLGLCFSFVVDFSLDTPLDFDFYTSCVSKFCLKIPNKFPRVFGIFFSGFMIFLHDKNLTKDRCINSCYLFAFLVNFF